MKFIITGGTGFVGQNLIPFLLNNGHKITVIGRNKKKARQFDWYGQIKFIEQDIDDTASPLPRELFQEHDAMLHLAWHGLPNYNDLFHFEVNLPANYHFLKYAIRSGLKRLVVAGTCMEYGFKSGPLSESTPAAPTTPYGLAKDSLRKFLEHLQHELSFDLQWARLFYMHGPGQSPNSLLASLDRAIKEGRSSFDMSKGEQLRDYLPISTVANKLANLLEDPKITGITNICSGAPISVRNLVENRVKELGANIKLNFGIYPYPDYEPMAFWGQTNDAKSI